MNRILVPLKEKAQAQELIPTACALAKALEVNIMVIHVVELPLGLPLDLQAKVVDGKGWEILTLAEEVAKGFGQTIATKLIHAREAGVAIVGEARSVRASLILLGYRRKKTLVERLIGTAGEHVLKHAPCRVLVEVIPERGGEPLRWPKPSRQATRRKASNTKKRA